MSGDLEAFSRRLARDFRWFCETFVRITGRDNRLTPFVFNRVQLVIWAHVSAMVDAGLPVRLWILKGRQFGCSTWFAAYLSWRAMFHGENGLILAHKEGPGKNMFAKVERLHRNLPVSARVGDVVVPVRPRVVAPSAAGTEMRFGDTSLEGGGVSRRLDSLVKRESAELVDAGVSETYQNLHLTELPIWKDAGATMAGLLPTVRDAAGTLVVAEFTARAAGSYTHQMWRDSVDGVSGFRALFLPWYWHEEYSRPRREGDLPLSGEEREYRDWVGLSGYGYPLDGRGRLLDPAPRGFRLSEGQLLWRRDRIREFRGDVDKFRREFPATPEEAWETSGRRVIPPAVMDRVALGVCEPVQRGEFVGRVVRGRTRPRWLRRDDGQIWLWERPRPGARYVVSADSSSGGGGDPSAAHVLRCSFGEVRVVASFRGQLRPHELAVLLARFGRSYRDGMLLDPGGRRTRGRPCLVVPERNYHGEHVIHELVENLGYRRVYRHTDKTRDDYRFGHDYGFPTSRASKMPMLQNLVQLCYEGRLVVPCERTVRDLRSLVYTNEDDSTAAAEQGEHDDLAMSVGIGGFVASDLGVVRRRRVESEDVFSSETGGVLFPVTGH